MKFFQSLFAILILSLLSSPVWSETIDDLVERNGKHYLKFTDEPFSGKVEGKVQGTLKDGVWVGKYRAYWDTGQLYRKGNYKDGKEEGFYETYHKNGQLWWKGNFKDGKREDGLWEFYNEYGKLSSKGNYKGGKLEGLWEFYNEHGQLKEKGNYKNGVKVK